VQFSIDEKIDMQSGRVQLTGFAVPDFFNQNTAFDFLHAMPAAQ
jgi:hypothetical protein